MDEHHDIKLHLVRDGQLLASFDLSGENLVHPSDPLWNNLLAWLQQRLALAGQKQGGTLDPHFCFTRASFTGTVGGRLLTIEAGRTGLGVIFWEATDQGRVVGRGTLSGDAFPEAGIPKDAWERIRQAMSD